MTGLRIHFAGVGGQGTQTASRILGEAAMRLDIPVLVAALHGMAQRGGAVTNQVMLGGVRSPLIEPGEADVLLGFEPLESARSAHLLRDGALAILSRNRVVPYTLTAGGRAYPDVDGLHASIIERADASHVLDASAVASRAGNRKAVGPVMLGALAGTGVLPFEVDHLRGTIDDISGAARRAVNLAAFDLGVQAVRD